MCPSTSPRKGWQLTPHPLPQGKEAPGRVESLNSAYLSGFPRGHDEVYVQSSLCLSSANDVALRTGLGKACSDRVGFTLAAAVTYGSGRAPGELGLSFKTQMPQARPIKAHFPPLTMATGRSSRTSLKAGSRPVCLPTTGSWAEQKCHSSVQSPRPQSLWC